MKEYINLASVSKLSFPFSPIQSMVCLCLHSYFLFLTKEAYYKELENLVFLKMISFIDWLSWVLSSVAAFRRCFLVVARGLAVAVAALVAQSSKACGR